MCACARNGNYPRVLARMACLQWRICAGAALRHFCALPCLRCPRLKPYARNRGVFEQLKAALQLPGECTRKGRALGGGVGSLFAGGERHLLPSFFHLLRHMHAQVQALLPDPYSSTP